MDWFALNILVFKHAGNFICSDSEGIQVFVRNSISILHKSSKSMEVKNGVLQDKSFLNWKLSNFYFIIVWERVYVCACACPYRTSMMFARPPSSKAEMTHETPQNRSFFVSYLVAYLTTQICWRLSCWSWFPGTGWGGMLVVTGDAMVTTRFVKSGCVAWESTWVQETWCKYLFTWIYAHNYISIYILYIYIFEIWHLFEFIVFVRDYRIVESGAHGDHMTRRCLWHPWRCLITWWDVWWGLELWRVASSWHLG